MDFRKLINTLNNLETNPVTVLHEADQSKNVIGMIQRYLKRGYIPTIRVDGRAGEETWAAILTYRTLLTKKAGEILGNQYVGTMPNIISQAVSHAADPLYSQKIKEYRKQFLANANSKSSVSQNRGTLPDTAGMSTQPHLPDSISKVISPNPIKSALSAIGTTANERLRRAYPTPTNKQVAWIEGKKYSYTGVQSGWVNVPVRPGLFNNNTEYKKVTQQYTTPGI